MPKDIGKTSNKQTSSKQHFCDTEIKNRYNS